MSVSRAGGDFQEVGDFLKGESAPESGDNDFPMRLRELREGCRSCVGIDSVVWTLDKPVGTKLGGV